jgi:hypothetical protein
VAGAIYLLTWTLLYVFSPLLIAAFTLPATASATRGLFQSLIEVCLWKIGWSVLAALLWSFALSEINSPKYDVDFLTAIVLNLMLAFSVLLTPVVVRSLVKGGMAGTANMMGGTLLAAAALTPTGLIAKGKLGASKLSDAFRDPPKRKEPKNKKSAPDFDHDCSDDGHRPMKPKK